MKVKISRNAAKVLQLELNKEENQGLLVRVQVTHKHGDHAHYGLGLDDKTKKWQKRKNVYVLPSITVKYHNMEMACKDNCIAHRITT